VPKEELHLHHCKCTPNALIPAVGSADEVSEAPRVCPNCDARTAHFVRLATAEEYTAFSPQLAERHAKRDSGFAYRHMYFQQNQDRLAHYIRRARALAAESNVPHCAVCIDPDDTPWRPLVDLLMPRYDWEAVRATVPDRRPAANSAIPLAFLQRWIGRFRPLLLNGGVLICPNGPEDAAEVDVFVMAKGGIAKYACRIPEEAIHVN